MDTDEHRCRRGCEIGLILEFIVPGKLRFPRVLRQGLLFKLRLIAAPSFAHFFERLCFMAKGP